MCQKPCARKLRASTAQGWRKPLIHELWLNASHVVNGENSKLHGESAQASRKRRASSAQARIAVVSLCLAYSGSLNVKQRCGDVQEVVGCWPAWPFRFTLQSNSVSVMRLPENHFEPNCTRASSAQARRKPPTRDEGILDIPHM